MRTKEILKVTTFKNFRSNAEIFAKDKDGNTRYFPIDYDYLSRSAVRSGNDTLQRAVIRELRSRYSEYKFIIRKSKVDFR